MPGNVPHHSDKMHRCVDEVMAKGHTKSSAYAICTTSLQKAGEPIFAAAETRTLHLRCALGTIRTATYENKEHIVVPVTALLEGVIHAVNADTPEFVSFASLSQSPQGWNGRPAVLGHPVKNGRQISANDPLVLEAHGLGKLFNTRIDNQRLCMDAWIDPARAEKLGGVRFLERLKSGDPIEVSVGAFVTTRDTPNGDYRGKAYKAEWVTIQPDHLAFLPEGTGACSLKMGCGAHRAAQVHLITAEGYVEVGSVMDIRTRFKSLMAALKKAEINEEPNEIVNLVVAAMKYKDCPTCDGTGQIKDAEGKQKDCETCGGKGELKVAAGARHSAEDRTAIQTVHDHAVSLGAECSPNNYRLAEGESQMTKEQRAEAITSLLADKHSGFTVGDEKMLEAASDERIEAFKAAAATRATDLKAAEDAAAAAKKAADDAGAKLKAAETRTLTEDEFMKVAPTSLKTLIERTQAADAARKTELVTVLKAAQAEFTEDELKAETLERLERMARALKVHEEDEQPASYRGKIVPRAAGEKVDITTPPDPYAAGLAALSAANTALGSRAH